MTRTWQDNAKEFAELDQGEGWPFAILIACSVEKGEGNGVRKDRSSLSDRKGLKTSAAEFATKAGTSAARVLRYLETWERYADKGKVPHVVELTPDRAHWVVAPEIPWRKQHGGEYEVPAGTESGAGTVRSAKSAIKKDPELAKELMADPEVRDAIEQAIVEEHLAPGTDERVAEVQEITKRSQERDRNDPLKDEIDIRIAADRLAKNGHWDVLQDAAGYVNGLLEAHTAQKLTPEMFNAER